MPRNAGCTDCPLHQHASSVCVWGEHRGCFQDGLGSEAGVCDLMLVGEAPGWEENNKGRPFVGPSGRLLKEALDTFNITSYYVSNTVKCVPDGTPSSSHVAACKHYLWEEIEAVKPKYILALGATAYHQFGVGSISEHAGKEFWSPAANAWVMGCLHPAAILRFPERKKTWLLDVGRFAKLAEGQRIEKPPVEVEIVKDHYSLVNRFEHGKPFTFDYETSMLPWWHKDFYAKCIAFSWDGKKSYVLFLDDPDVVRSFFWCIKPVMMSPKTPKTAHNMLFDDLVTYRLCGYLPFTTFDTMVAAQILDENQPKGLKWQGRARLGWPSWDIETSKKSGEGISRADLAFYNGCDAAATFLLREALLRDLRDAPNLARYMVRLEMPKLRALERLISAGIHIRTDRLQERISTATTALGEARAAVPVKNPNSTAQLKKWLYTDLNLPVLKWTPKGEPSTDEETIKRLAMQHEEVRVILPARKWQKSLTTYLQPLMTALETSHDGRIHPEYRSTSVETGRLASSFHTTPRDQFIRSVYSAPAGSLLVMGDYAQIEARLAAWKAVGMPAILTPNDSQTGAGRTMLHAWLAGLDVYVETAAEILRKSPSEVTKDKSDPHNERQIVGKVVTLALLYRMSAKGLREYLWREEEIEWTQHQAEQAHQGFYRRWPEFALWHEREDRIIRSLGYSESPIGRMRRLPAAQAVDTGRQAYSQIHEAVNAGINAPIQGLASDITQAAMILLDRVKDKMGFLICGNIHDALLFEVPEDRLQTVLPIIRDAMLWAPNALRGLGLHLPEGLIQVEISVGDGWGLGKEVKF